MDPEAGNLLSLDLSPQQEQAILLLTSGYSLSCVSQEVGISRRTLYNWMHLDDGFIAIYKELRDKQFTENMNRRLSLEALALERLADLVTSGDSHVSLKAIQLALNARSELT